MGAGASRDGGYGVPINPRVDYALSRSRKENKIVRIDAPALVKLKHGTLRYRFDKTADNPSRREKPHEHDETGTNLKQRQDYFYHPKHNDLSSDKKSMTPDESWKYCQVYKGPERAKQKKLYYVFGKGLKVNNDNGFIEHNYKPEEQTFRRPIFYKVHGHVYLDLIFLKESVSEDGEIQDEDEQTNPLDPNEDEDPMDPENLKDMEVKMEASTTIFDIKVKLSRKLIKPISHIHMYLKGNEIRSDQKLQDFNTNDTPPTTVKILLHPK